MKTISRILLATIAMFTLMAFASIREVFIGTKPIIFEIKPAEIAVVKPEMEPIKIKIRTTNHDDFLDAIGFRESGNRYYIVNRFGYMGKYQFGKETLKTIKIKTTKEEFLNNPELQEEAMLKLLKYNKRKLKKYIEEYDGEVVHGVLVTESGLLAAAHLGGAGSVKKWFRNGKVRQDGNGVKITSYMLNFNGYQLDLN